MRKTVIILIALLLGSSLAFGQEYSNGVGVSNVEFVLDGEDLLMELDPDTWCSAMQMKWSVEDVVRGWEDFG